MSDKSPHDDAPPPEIKPNPHPRGSADYYLFELDAVDDLLRAGSIEPLDAGRTAQYWRDRAAERGLDLAEISASRLDPINRLLANPVLVEHNEQDLVAIRDSMAAAETLTAEAEDVKKKWIDAIDLTLQLQQRALQNVVNFGIYVVRNQEDNSVLTMEAVHMGFFGVWNDPQHNNSLVEAPPGTGKTTCLCIQDLWDLKNDQKLRFLKVCMDLETARLRLDVVRTYIKCRRLRAIAPYVRLDPDKPDNSNQFTIVRANIGSQDPTMKAAGATSEIQGAGFDIIDADDLCGNRVRREEPTRKKITDNFNNVIMRRRRDFVKSRVRYICTPWHPDDTAARIKRDIRDGKLRNWRTARFPVREDAQGNPIPVIHRPGIIEEILSAKATDPATYACCFKLDPRDELLSKFKSPKFYDIEGGKSKNCPEKWREVCEKMLAGYQQAEHWLVVDPSGGGRDHTEIVRFALTFKGLAAITEAWSIRAQSSEVAEFLAGLAETHPNDKLLIENQAFGGKVTADWWTEYLCARLGDDYRKNVHYSGTRLRNEAGKAIGQNVSKGQRWYSAIAYMENGSIRLPGTWQIINGVPTLSVCEDSKIVRLVEQLLNYPNVTQDGGVDCVSMFINVHHGRLQQTVEPLKPRPAAPTAPVKVRSVLSYLYEQRMAQVKKQRPVADGADVPDRMQEAELFALQEVA